jgi:hypothetical protein
MLLLLLLQVHEQEFGSESASGWVNGTFYMDPSLGRDTVMAVYFYSRDFNTHVGDIRLVSPDGVEHRGISETAMASLYVTPLEPIEKVIKIFLFFPPGLLLFTVYFILQQQQQQQCLYSFNILFLFFLCPVWSLALFVRQAIAESPIAFRESHVKTEGPVDNIGISATTAGTFDGQTSHCSSGRRRCPLHFIGNGNEIKQNYLIVQDNRINDILFYLILTGEIW